MKGLLILNGLGKKMSKSGGKGPDLEESPKHELGESAADRKLEGEPAPNVAKLHCPHCDKAIHMGALKPRDPARDLASSAEPKKGGYGV